MKSWAWAAVGLLVGGVVMSGAACSSGGGGSGGGGVGGGGGSQGTHMTTTTTTVNPTMSTGTTMGDCGSLPAQFMPAACGTCVGDKCCSEAKACDQGSDCFSLLQCELGGMMNCETQFPMGVDPLNKLNSCITTNCSGASFSVTFWMSGAMQE